MSISITNHAVDRYAQRIVGIDDPETLSREERATIRGAIRRAVPEPGDGNGMVSWTVRRRDAVYIVQDLTVVTVLLPWQWAEQRRRAYEGLHA